MFKSLIKLIFLFTFLANTLYANSVKITLIERLTQFIEWPYLDNEFKIGVYKNDNITYDIEEAYENKKIHRLPIKVYNIKDEHDLNLNQLNILYFPAETNLDSEKIISKIDKYPVLTITDYANDVYSGMHIGLYYENKKLKFIINKEAIDKSGLKASYKLLKLAKIVKRGEQ
jgi:hypothetical protein